MAKLAKKFYIKLLKSVQILCIVYYAQIYKYAWYNMHMEERHRLVLIKQNPQWTDGSIDVPEFKRDLYKIIRKYMEYKQIIAVVGIRRVGKTVMIKQILKDLKTDKKNICYISFDDRDFQKYEIANDLIEYFIQNSDKNKKRYLFLDEIQKISNWQDLLKNLYDIEKNLKIVLSGSSSLELKKYKETLAGRILTFHMPIFTFMEFVRYHNMVDNASLKTIGRDYDLNFLSKKMLYHELFRKYLIKGAFPELIEIDDEDYIRKYISEVIEKILVDISNNIESGKVIELSNLITLLSKSTGRLFEINNLASVLKLNRNTVSKYIDLLEKSFLLKISYNYTKSVSKKLRTGKKGYIAHSSIPINILNYPFDISNIEGVDLGHLIETIVVGNLDNVNFWKHQNYEIDIILNKIPVEIKYQAKISKFDLKNVINYMETFKTNIGFVVTKDIMNIIKKDKKKIFLIPAWLFLLLDFNEIREG